MLNRTIQASLFAEESHLAVGIASYQTNHHGFLFATLETVHAAELHAREFLLERSQDAQLIMLAWGLDTRSNKAFFFPEQP